MDWLRCNMCYRPMKKSKRTFSLTQCGHLYCSQCMTKVTTKCPECGTQNFTTMTLPYPPRLETTHNYFAPLEDFMEICVKTEEFQHNQWCIAMRGFEEIEKKYENMKRSYWKGMEQMKSLSQALQNLQAEEKDLEATRNPLLKSMEVQKCRASMSGLNFSEHSRNQRIPGHFSMTNNPETSRFHEEQRSAARFPTSDGNWENSRLRTPDVAYDPRTPFASKPFRSNGYATDSGVSSILGTSSSRADVFRVPSGQRVPRSAAVVKRKTPTSTRLTQPKTGFNS